MTTKVVFAAIVMSMIVLGGCGMTVDEASVIARCGTEMTARMSVPEPLSVDAATKTLAVIEKVRPAIEGLGNDDDISVAIKPLIEDLVSEAIEDEKAAGVATRLIASGLSMGQAYLRRYPELTTKTGNVAQITWAAMTGIHDGLTAAIREERDDE